MGLKEEAEQGMKERYRSNITAKAYQIAAETAIFPKEKHRVFNSGPDGRSRRDC